MAMWLRRTGELSVTVAGQPLAQPVYYLFADLAKPHVVLAVRPLTGPVRGGTALTLLGSGFGGVAVVELQEVSTTTVGAGGSRSLCAWEGLPGMSCNDTMIRCLVCVCTDPHPLHMADSRCLALVLRCCCRTDAPCPRYSALGFASESS